MTEQLGEKRDGNESRVGWQQRHKRVVGLNFFFPSGKDVLLLLSRFEGQMNIKGGTNEHFGGSKQRDV